MIYWDTACVVKLYVEESDSAQWAERAVSASDGFISSVLLRTELAFCFEQKQMRGHLKQGASKALLNRFDHDVSEGRFQLIPIGSDVLQVACHIASDCYHADPAIHVRTLDGIHLATAHLLKCPCIATTDVRMLAAAAFLGFKRCEEIQVPGK